MGASGRGLRLLVGAIAILALVASLLLPPFIRDRRRYAASLGEGRAMVRAVYSYHAKKGTWPADLQDLVPGFLPAVPDRWGYIYSKGDPAPRLMKLSALHTYLTYYFPPATHPLFPAGVDAGWVRDFEGQQMYLAGD